MAIEIAQAYSYRHAKAILDAEYPNEKRETVGKNVANFERITRKLPHAKMGITLPI